MSLWWNKSGKWYRCPHGLDRDKRQPFAVSPAEVDVCRRYPPVGRVGRSDATSAMDAGLATPVAQSYSSQIPLALSDVRLPTGIAVDAAGNVYVTDVG